jgi:hypothetical protein
MSFNKKQLGKDAAEAKKPISKQQLKPIIPPMKKGGMTKKC